MLEASLQAERRTRRRRRMAPLGVERLEDRFAPAGQPLVVEPPVIHSDPVTHVLTATLTEQLGPAVIDGQTVAGTKTYDGLFRTDADGESRRFTGPHDRHNLSEPTNLHTHGLHGVADRNADNIFLVIPAGGQNEYHIQIPANAPEGLFWFHPHQHMLADEQVYSAWPACW